MIDRRMGPDTIYASVASELYNPSASNWDELWPSISKLEEECFPGKGLGEDHLKGIFESDTSIVLLLKKGSDIIGFSCGIPDENVADAIYIETTEITPSQQDKGYVVKMMNQLEGEARQRGYKFITRDSEIANGYADKISKNYGDRALETEDHESEYSMGRMQRFFKIAL
jgi:hypothetical protein